MVAAVNDNNLRMPAAKTPLISSTDLFEAWRSADAPSFEEAQQAEEKQTGSEPDAPR